MNEKSTMSNVVKIVLPLLLGGAILYWMYRGFDFERVRQVVLHEMDWTWMLLSFPFGIMAMALRGWRWRQTLEPLGKQPRKSVVVNSIFLSYAASLVVPRIGEFTRCGVLKRWEDISFTKALGFTWAGWLVSAICLVAMGVLLWVLLRHLSIYNKVKTTLNGIREGIISLKSVRSVPLFVVMTVGIWLCYFLHYYLTFFCFDFTQNLGFSCALVTFVVGSIAVIVPTPNGAGPWHFAVKTMLILYGVADEQALYFVLIVHTVQTLLVVLMGVYAWVRLGFVSRFSEVRGYEGTEVRE